MEIRVDTRARRAGHEGASLDLWAMRRNPGSWSRVQTHAMHWLQRANLKTARAWQLKMALREVFAHARQHNQTDLAAADLKGWISWAR